MQGQAFAANLLQRVDEHIARHEPETPAGESPSMYAFQQPAITEIDLRREQIGLWQDLHEDSYREELVRGDPTFNVIGWDSNYTGLPLPEAEQRLAA